MTSADKVRPWPHRHRRRRARRALSGGVESPPTAPTDVESPQDDQGDQDGDRGEAT
jgi:hypothetical protein